MVTTSLIILTPNANFIGNFMTSVLFFVLLFFILLFGVLLKNHSYIEKLLLNSYSIQKKLVKSMTFIILGALV